ncbi:TPA: hypothetical protein DCX16_02625 [bacterium]|nr:hypothetical protein [bacterium]
MKKILFIIGSFEGGGAERILVRLIQKLPRDKFSPMIAVWKKEGPLLEYLPKDITLFALRPNLHKLLAPIILVLGIFKLASIIKRERPNLILSFLELSIFLAFFAKRIAGVKTLLWAAERGSPTSTYFAKEHINLFRHLLFYKFVVFYCYPRVDGVLVCSFGLKELLEENVPNIKRIEVIQSGYPIEEIEEASKEDVGHPWIKEERDYYLLCASGRVTWVKNYSLLISSFAKLIEEGIKCKLLIIGKKNENSKEFKRLEKLIKELRQEENICFLGFQSNPWKYVAKCDLFILTSHYEGFPNVIVEAMICQTPVVSVDCIGAKEILEDRFGYLVRKDQGSLKEAIKSLLLDEKKREILKEEGKNRALYFSFQNILPKYISFLSSYSN